MCQSESPDLTSLDEACFSRDITVNWLILNYIMPQSPLSPDHMLFCFLIFKTCRLMYFYSLLGFAS